MRRRPAHRLLQPQRRPAPSLPRPATDFAVRLHDGRRLGIAEFGSRSSLPVIYCHGFLGSRLEPAAGEIDGINIIAFDRPGYGRSDLQRLPSLRGFGADVAEALVQLGVGPCIVVGVSTGAPYALAIASVLGQRVRRVILAGGIAGPEVLETAGGIALVLSLLGRRGSRTGRLLQRIMRLAVAARLERRFVSLALATERKVLERQGVALEALRAGLLQSLRAGSRRSLRGPMADARLVAQPWDFSLLDIETEVHIVHGADDSVVPPIHAHWYAAHLPHSRLELVPGELHLSLCFRSAARIQAAVRELEEVGRSDDPEGNAALLAEAG
ncbi:alpha/beta fold hydrolase [Benzoatithermus flavus]|uniref:Alpha/beta hydrolase n=1 Tax=Benzoatithermus flavus TaxID=3108223 RepID=A0ABU8XT48_9PROT